MISSPASTPKKTAWLAVRLRLQTFVMIKLSAVLHVPCHCWFAINLRSCRRWGLRLWFAVWSRGNRFVCLSVTACQDLECDSAHYLLLEYFDVGPPKTVSVNNKDEDKYWCMYRFYENRCSVFQFQMWNTELFSAAVFEVCFAKTLQWGYYQGCGDIIRD